MATSKFQKKVPVAHPIGELIIYDPPILGVRWLKELMQPEVKGGPLVNKMTQIVFEHAASHIARGSRESIMKQLEDEFGKQ